MISSDKKRNDGIWLNIYFIEKNNSEFSPFSIIKLRKLDRILENYFNFSFMQFNVKIDFKN